MTIRIINADVLAGLAMLSDESVHCCVTSPPYWGLRDYETATWVGGDAMCDHIASTLRTGGGLADLGGRYRGGGHKAGATSPIQFADVCGKCGARRIDQQIGLEPSPDDYIAKLVAVFRELRRVLRRDGTLWLNLGDSYASRGGAGWQGLNGSRADRRFTAPNFKGNSAKGAAVKPKDLIGMPWMVAFALRADGWWLRQEIIWSKPNPTPESVRDRCTKAHEHLFLLSKGQRYFFDQEAIRENRAGDEDANGFRGGAYVGGTPGRRTARGNKRVKIPGGWDTADGAHGTIHRTGRTVGQYGDATMESGRNKRSVWTIATQPYPEAHFATFPEALAETCILAGCPAGGTVLDPFGGAGTTGLVADRLTRNAILIELNPRYAEMARARIAQPLPIFSSLVSLEQG